MFTHHYTARGSRIASRMAFLLLAAAVQLAWAKAQYAIGWSSIDGGGGTSTGGVYSVSGSIGQPDAGSVSGGPYSISGGFWNTITVIQTPGAPRLSLTRSNNAVIVSWPLSAVAFNLEQTSVFSDSWTTVAPPYNTNATSFYFSIPSSTGQRYFRLHKL